MCFNVRATGSVSLWIDTGFPREKNEKCTNRIDPLVDRSVSAPGFSSIRSTSYFAPDRSKNWIDPVRSRVNGTLYPVHFWIDLLPDRSRGIEVLLRLFYCLLRKV